MQHRRLGLRAYRNPRSDGEDRMIVSKLKGARQRKRATGVKVEGRKSYAAAVPATVERAKALKAEGLTLRQVADRLAAEGRQTRAGTPYHFTAVGRMISGRTR